MADLIVEILIAFLCVTGVVCLIKSVYDKIYTEEAEKNLALYKSRLKTLREELEKKNSEKQNVYVGPGSRVCKNRGDK